MNNIIYPVCENMNEKGIVITELEMDMMIEAVVNGFNQGLQKDGDFIESL